MEMDRETEKHIQTTIWHPKCGFKIGLMFFAMLQLTRLGVITSMAYLSYHKLLVEMEGVIAFDQAVDYHSEYTDNGEESGEEYDIYDKVFYYPDDFTEELHMEGHGSDDHTAFDIILVVTPLCEIVTAAGIIFSLMGPFSEGIPKCRWILWLVKLRVTWMRALWTLTAVSYVILTVIFRNTMYEETENAKYINSPFLLANMSLLVIEYALLGMLECTVKVYTVDRLQQRLNKAKMRMAAPWGTLSIGVFLLCTAVFAIRNFTVSLYFGLISVFVTQKEQEQLSGSTKTTGIFNILVVLRIYLAVMRGKYFNYFIRLCFGYFLAEEEDFTFITSREREEMRKKKRKKSENREKKENCECESQLLHK